jgi:hypothetical protein
MRVRGHENIWAGGDCVEVLDLVSGRERHIALGTHANKHGQVIGANVGGGYATFPGVVGTAVSKVCDLEIARTGLREKDARRAGLRFETVTIESTSRAGYYPGADPMTVKMLAERRTGRLLGVQIVGQEGAAKRVDIAAVALTAGMTVEQMTALDLGYAPPFSPVWDPILVAARKAVIAVRRRYSAALLSCRGRPFRGAGNCATSHDEPAADKPRSGPLRRPVPVDLLYGLPSLLTGRPRQRRDRRHSRRDTAGADTADGGIGGAC